jgi:hypothetical protein
MDRRGFVKSRFLGCCRICCISFSRESVVMNFKNRKAGASMKIEDLRDPRDRDFCLRQEKGQSVHVSRQQDKVWRVVHHHDGTCHPECRVIANYDAMAEREFQMGSGGRRRTEMISTGPTPETEGFFRSAKAAKEAA